MFSTFGFLQQLLFGGVARKRQPPTITAQPPEQVLYQQDGALAIRGAAATGYTALTWQRSDNGTSWADVTNQQGLNMVIATATYADRGYWRLKAVNGNSDPAFSRAVEVVCVYMKIQNDVNPTDPGMVQKSRTSYEYTTPAGTKYMSAFYVNQADGQNFTPKGLSTARAVTSWSTDNNTVAPVVGTGQPGSGNVRATGQIVPNITPGVGTMTARIGNLVSTVKYIAS